MGTHWTFLLGNKTGGFHYEGLSDATSKVVQITKAPDANGVYQAMVEIGGKVKKTPSTFFPKSWSPEKIIDAIQDLYFNPTGVDTIRKMYDGVVDGVNIRLFLMSMARLFLHFLLCKRKGIKQWSINGDFVYIIII